LEINGEKNYKNHSNSWRLNSTLLNNQWVTEEIRIEIKKFLHSKENEGTTYQNLWHTTKAVVRKKLIA
jgi:hypothetical protein